MDTTQVPQFKLAKVGKERDRKKAGAWWNFGRGARGWTGATGGAGQGGIGLLSFGQAAVIAVASVLGIGAYSIGAQMAKPETAASTSSKIFNAREQAKSETASVAGPVLPSSIGMVSGSLDGKTPEQRAAEEAAAKAAAEEEARRKAAEEEAARKKAEEEAAAAAAAEPPAVADPAAMAAAAAQANAPAKGMGSRFGQLSSGLGGGRSGLSGGAGLSGGVGRSFAPVNSRAKAADAAGFDKGKVASKQSAKVAKVGKAKGRGKAFKQLMNANLHSRNASGSKSLETAATAADTAFSNGKGGGEVISGGGAETTTQPDQTPSATPTTGGPLGGGEGTTEAPAAPSADVSPWAKELEVARAMTIACTIALMILGIISACSNSPFTGFLKALIIAVGVIIAALGVTIAGLGIAMLAKGAHGALGGIYIAAGAAIGIAGVTVVMNAGAGGVASGTISGKIGIAAGLLAGILGGAGGGMADKGADGKTYHGVPASL